MLQRPWLLLRVSLAVRPPDAPAFVLEEGGRHAHRELPVGERREPEARKVRTGGHRAPLDRRRHAVLVPRQPPRQTSKGEGPGAQHVQNRKAAAAAAPAARFRFAAPARPPAAPAAAPAAAFAAPASAPAAAAPQRSAESCEPAPEVAASRTRRASC